MLWFRITMKRVISFSCLSALCVLLSGGCSPFRPLQVESVEKSAAYDELFPHHIEVCALSRIKPLDEGKKGSRAGHAVLFLEGACRDETFGFPQLRVCSNGRPLEHSETGTGISVNRMFKNVNWVAVPAEIPQHRMNR